MLTERCDFLPRLGYFLQGYLVLWSRRRPRGQSTTVFCDNSSFDPQTLVLLETAFDEAWLTLKSVGNKTVKPDELARSVLRTAMEGERDPVRLHDRALDGLLPATIWREAS